MRNKQFLDLAQSAYERFQKLQNEDLFGNFHYGYSDLEDYHNDYLYVKLKEESGCHWYTIWIKDEVLDKMLGCKSAELEVFYNEDEGKISISREDAFAKDNKFNRVLKVNEISSILDKIFKIHENFEYIESKCSADYFFVKMHAYMQSQKYPDISEKTQQDLDEIAGIVENSKVFERDALFRDILHNEFSNLTDDQMSVLNSVIGYNDISYFVYNCKLENVLKRKLVQCGDRMYVEIAGNNSEVTTD